MCGIFCVFGEGYKPSCVDKLNHRGPDMFDGARCDKCYMEFSRLCINDTSQKGMQPFLTSTGSMLVCNGEIYNHSDLYKNEETQSDCECLIPLIEKLGFYNTAQIIKGVFAICYSDGTNLFAMRDPIGVRPLFYTRFGHKKIAMASEVKALAEFDSKVEIFPPGHIYDSRLDIFISYYPCYWDFPSCKLNLKTTQKYIYDTFTRAVERRVTNTDREVGFFLSGGLDSSMVAAVGKKLLGKQIKTFSIGTVDSPDGIAAAVMADYLEADHTHVNFDFEEGLGVLSEVIKSLETYDVTTIRASVPMWLLSRYIKQNTDCRVILSGEGSDELFGGYLYFQYAPSVQEFFNENIRRLRLLHQYDVLRSDRCTAAHGLEVRVPFLDKDFIECGMIIDQNLKFRPNKMEKWILRETFKNDLPHSIAWRQKDAFSDAVGYNWVDEVKKYAENNITDKQFDEIKSKTKFHNCPLTKEEALYRSIFWKEFGGTQDHLVGEIWRTKWTDQIDPSAKYLPNHGIKNSL